MKRDLQGELNDMIKGYTQQFLLDTVSGVTRDMFSRQLNPNLLHLAKQTMRSTPMTVNINPIDPIIFSDAELVSRLVAQMSKRSATFTSYEGKLFEALLEYQLKSACREEAQRPKRPRDDEDKDKDKNDEPKRQKKSGEPSSVPPPPQRTPSHQRSLPRSSTNKPQDSEFPPQTEKTGDHFEYTGGDDEEVPEPQ